MAADNVTDEIRPGARPPRAWWQWVLGVGLLSAAGVMLAIRYVPQLQSLTLTKPVASLPIRVLPTLAHGDAVPVAAGALSGCNLLVVTLDTTRADRIGCYGNTDIATPTLDGLAADGVLFSQVYTVAPTTLPSHASILTGLHPYHHGARANAVFRLEDGCETLAEVLSGHGYLTGAVVSSFVLDSQFGLAQGFTHYDDEFNQASRRGWAQGDPERPADQTTDRAIAWLRGNSADRFFLWVHYFDPHAEYSPPAPYDKRYANMPYDGEIAFVDSQLGRLLRAVNGLGLTDKTLVVVVGDHGEALGQHDEWTHGHLLYDATLHVPLLMACGDRVGGGLHIDRQVSVVDIVPTVTAMLGVGGEMKTDGIDLALPAGEARPIFMESVEGLVQWGFAALRAVRIGPMKYIHGPDPELYDLSQDSQETRNLVASQPETAGNLRRILSAFFEDESGTEVAAKQTSQLSPQELAKLRSLGYLSGEGAGLEFSGSRPDPKAMTGLVRRVQLALGIKTHDEQVARLEEIAADAPDFYMVHRLLGEAYAATGELERSETAFRRALELQPKVSYTLRALGRLRAAQHDFEGAEAFYRRMLAAHPDDFIGLSEFGLLLSQLQRFDEAGNYLVEAFKLRPTDESIAQGMTVALARAGRSEQARALLDERLAAQPHLVVVRNTLAGVYAEKQDYKTAIALLREGIELTPTRFELANNLALTLLASTEDRPDVPREAVSIMERVCEQTAYGHAGYLKTLALSYAVMRRLDEAIAMGERALRIAQENKETELARMISQNLKDYRASKEEGADSLMPLGPPATADEGEPDQ